MLIKNTNLSSIILSSSNYKEKSDRVGKFKYHAKKEFIEEYKYHILNTKKAFEINKLVIFDFDFPCFNQNSPYFNEFQKLDIVKEVIKLINEKKICYSSSPNGIKIYLVVKDETLLSKLNKTYLASNSIKWQLQNIDGEIKEKECNIEVLHLLSHHCDFAFCNDKENTYYQVYNQNNLFKEFDVSIIKPFFDCLFALEVKHYQEQNKPLEYNDFLQNKNTLDTEKIKSNIFSSFHKFVNRKTSKYRGKNTTKFIQSLVKDPESFYKYLIEFDPSYVIQSGNASNAITRITPFFYQSDKPTFLAFVSYIEESIYPNINNCDFTYFDKIPDEIEKETFINFEGEEVILIGEDERFKKILIVKRKNHHYNTFIFKNLKSLISFSQTNLSINLSDEFINQNKNNKISIICDKRIKDSVGRFKDLDDNIRDDYSTYTHYLNTYSKSENSKILIKKWQKNPAQFKDKGNINNYPKLKILLENLFLDNSMENNLIVQAGHFVFDLKPQFANIWSDEGGTGKDFYQNLKRFIYGDTYIKSAEIANGFLPSNIDEKTLFYHSEFSLKKDELDKFKDLISSNERLINIKGKDPRKLDCSKIMYEYTTNNIISITHKNFDYALARRINYIYSENRKKLHKILDFNFYDPYDFEDLANELASFFYGIVYDYSQGDLNVFTEIFTKACEELVEENLAKFKQLENETKADEIENNALCESITETFKTIISNEKREEVLSILETFNLKDSPIFKAFENRDKFVYWKDIKVAFNTISKPYLKTKNGKNLYFNITKKEKKIGTQRFLLSFQ